MRTGAPSRIVVPTTVESPDYEWVLPVDDGDLEAMGFGTMERLAPSWTPIEVYILHRDGRTRMVHAEMPWHGSGTLIMRRAAAEVIRPLVEGQAELLPLRCDEDQLWALHVTEVRDALDEDASDIVRFPSSGRILTVRTHVFRPEQLDGARCFKLPQMPRGRLYLAGDLADTIEAAGLSGFATEVVWTAPQVG